MNGYQGRMLIVDLTEGKILIESFDEQFARKYIGGVGFGTRLLYDRLAPHLDPLSPLNHLIFSTGPFSTVNFLGSTGISIVSKSPLTGLIGDSDFRGTYGRNLHSCGYDILMIKGKANTPVYIEIGDDSAEIKDAKNLWGKMTGEVQSILSQKIGKGANILSIGPAGEHLVKYACISGDVQFFAGRLGMGAVMGSKNLKAILIKKGKKEIPIANHEGLKTLMRKVLHEIQHDGTCDALSKYGTWNVIGPGNVKGILPTKNFQKTTFEKVEQIDGEGLLKTIYAGKRACPGCPIGCRRVVKGGGLYPEISQDYGGPQYETVAALGSTVLLGDPFAIAKANELCNLYGLDTISTGVTIAFAMECVDKSVLTKKDIGFDLKWGDPEGILKLIPMIALREGIGDMLAEGVKKVSEKIGKGSQEWGMHVKGLEIPMHDPRGKKGVGLGYATTTKGADHVTVLHDECFERENALPDLGFVKPMGRKEFQGKPLMAKKTQDLWGVIADVLPVCKFTMSPPRPVTPDVLVSVLRFITGWDISLDEFLTVGERVFNLSRLFNVKEGVDRTYDTLPPRFAERLQEGGSAGEAITKQDLDKMLDEYYDFRGWSREGIPKEELLLRLGLKGDF
jgi:aldehyde:ferredoxin oxidoreductase